MNGIVFGLPGNSIKSVQRIFMAPNAISTNVAISPVDMSKTCLFSYNYKIATSSNMAADKAIGATLTTTGNVKLECSAADPAQYISVTIIEFASNVTVQRGETTLTSVTISPVVTARSFVSHSFIGGTSSSTGTFPMSTGYLNDSTTVVFGGFLTHKNKISWEVVSFN